MVSSYHRQDTSQRRSYLTLRIPAARLKPLFSQMHTSPMLRGTWLCRCAPRAAWEHTRRAAVEPPSRRSMPRSASVDTIVLRSRCRRRERRARIRAVFMAGWASFPLFPVAAALRRPQQRGHTQAEPNGGERLRCAHHRCHPAHGAGSLMGAGARSPLRGRRVSRDAGRRGAGRF